MRDATPVSAAISRNWPQFFLFRFAIFLQPSDFVRQLLLQRFSFIEFARVLRLADFIFQKQLLLRDTRFESGIDLGDLILLFRRQRNCRVPIAVIVPLRVRRPISFFVLVSFLLLLLLLLVIESM